MGKYLILCPCKYLEVLQKTNITLMSVWRSSVTLFFSACLHILMLVKSLLRAPLFLSRTYMNSPRIKQPPEVLRQLECMRKEQSILNTKRLELLNSLRYTVICGFFIVSLYHPSFSHRHVSYFSSTALFAKITTLCPFTLHI